MGCGVCIVNQDHRLITFRAVMSVMEMGGTTVDQLMQLVNACDAFGFL